MAKLNQIVAVVAGKKTRTEKEFGDLNKVIQKQDLFSGLTRQYRSLEDGGEQLPNENKFPQKNVEEIIGQAKDALLSIIDAVATQEYGNQDAKANVEVDGKVVLQGVPVTVLLYLEKQVTDIHTFINNMPTLDQAERWSFNAQTKQYSTEPVETIRTKKINKPIVLYPATPEHPAQTQLVTEDIAAGKWITTKYSTLMSASRKQEVLGRIVQLQDAIKMAREAANSIEVKQVNIAQPLLTHIFR